MVENHAQESDIFPELGKEVAKNREAVMITVAPNSKLFNHRRYVFYQAYRTKREAQSEAKRRRKLGYQVRVVAIPDVSGAYDLYERGMGRGR